MRLSAALQYYIQYLQYLQYLQYCCTQPCACLLVFPRPSLSPPAPIFTQFTHPASLLFLPFFSSTPNTPFSVEPIDWHWLHPTALHCTYTVLVVLLKNSYSFVSQRSTGVQQSYQTPPAVALPLLATQIDSGPVQPVHHPSPQPTTTAHSPPSPKVLLHTHSPVHNVQPAFSKRSPSQFHFLPRLTSPHRVAYHTPHTPYNPPPSHSLGHPTTPHNSTRFAFSLSSASASASAAHCRLSPIYLALSTCFA